MLRKKVTNTLIVLSLFMGTAFAQESSIYTNADKNYKEGLNLYEKGKFGVAQKLFQKAVADFGSDVSQQKADAEFYFAMCAIELTNNDAEYLIGQFIAKYPESQKIDLAYFQMGKLRYMERDYKKAVYWFKRTNKNGIHKDLRPELSFKLGYSYFNLGQKEDASRLFFEIKDTDNKYASPATYYYSHIAYEQKNFATALKGFTKLSDDETFAPLVPYYITHIHYLQQNYQKVVEYAPELLESASPKRAPEIARLIGESYFHLRKYAEAASYFEKYTEKSQSISRSDYYIIGFTYYRNSDFEKAAQNLERVSTEDDSLSQNAYYHLADCYLKQNDKNKARQAFGMASKSTFDPIIKEDALFNFAKITYEMFYSPFNEAIDAFREYIEQYPDSPRTDEAYNYLVLAYSNTKNYKDALISLEKIRNKDANTRGAYQRVAFFRGIELFQNLSYQEAIEKFDLSLKFPEYNRILMAQALYWKAEANYRMGNFEAAAKDYNEFILTAGSFELPEYKIAHYNLGYANFKQKKYDDAIVWFRKYADISAKEATPMLGDAHNRTGDSYFIQRRYWVAIDYYDKAITVNTLDGDYAMFQKAFSFGLVERPQKKIETLIALLEKYPESSYLDDALFEIAESNIILNQPQEAAKYYSQIVHDYSSSSYHVKSLVQLGLLAYNNELSDSAMGLYKRVVEQYPGTSEAKNALTGIRNIYVDKGDVNSYFSYAGQLGSFANISIAEKDSLTYIAAEKLYMEGNCSKSSTGFTSYLAEYPKGNFTLNASFYLADCQLRQGQHDKALENLIYVIQKPKNDFTEQALLSASRIYLSQNKFAEAYETYDLLEGLAEVKNNLLEARIGKLRAAFALERHSEVILAAAKVLSSDKLAEEQEREARFKMAKSHIALGQTSEAFDQFATVARAPKTLEGAESRYLMASILRQQGKLDKAEAEVFSFAEVNTPHQYWLAKSFILLADIYADKDDFFQAKATLQSVLDGYSNTTDGIIDEATNKLNELVKTEKDKQAASKSDTIEIKFKE